MESEEEEEEELSAAKRKEPFVVKSTIKDDPKNSPFRGAGQKP